MVLKLRGLADGAYPGPKGWKLNSCSSEKETLPVGGQLGNGRGYQGKLLFIKVFEMSRSLPLP